MFGPAFDLFVVSSGLLFLELACIRWFPANVRTLSYFSNFALMSCFLGMSLGLLRTRSRSWLPFTLPILAILTTIVGSLPLSITIEQEALKSNIYFGAEWLNQPGLVNVPFWAFLIPTCLLISGMFAGLGQVMGRLFEEFTPLKAYSINLAGSIFGIAVFMVISFFALNALVWFSLAGLAILWLLRGSKKAMALSLACLVLALFMVHKVDGPAIWSPYNRITIFPHRLSNYDIQSIVVNGFNHQNMTENIVEPFYDVPYLLSKGLRGERPVGRVMVIGAGSGNDVSHALAQGAEQVDAVEIDPRIQKIGREMHPMHPYADPRVKPHVNDGRAYMRSGTGQDFDYIVYAYVDSTTLFSQYGAVRLENYLFTEDAFRDAKSRLKPDGIFVAYNYYRRPWLALRIMMMLERVFGPDNVCVVTLPAKDVLSDQDNDINLVLFLAGDVKEIKAKLATKLYSFKEVDHQLVLEHTETPAKLALFPVKEIRREEPLELTSDDWPFPYLQNATIPPHNIHGVLILLALTVILLTTVGGVRPGKGSFNLHFFCLGAAFMLIETRGIARMALLFGSTWVTNSLTFIAILTLIFFANLVAGKVQLKYPLLYGGLMLAVGLDLLIPLQSLLGLDPSIRGLVGAVILFLPIFFAGLIFSRSFAASEHSERDLGSNILGAVVGGCLENVGVLIGYRWLLLVSAGLYLLSWAAVGTGDGRRETGAVEG